MTSTSATLPQTLLASPAAQGRWPAVEALPCRVSVEVRLPRLTVRDLFLLQVGSLLESEWAQSTNVPVRVNGQLIGWAEFEVLGDNLAIRMTEFL
jgi:flagellar motor switch/type III secretory pathway protein FliN